MPPDILHWHSEARAFVAGVEVLPHIAAPLPLPSGHIAETLRGLFNTFGKAPVCVSNSPIEGLEGCSPFHLVTLTGGTSGMPKAILRSHASWTTSFHTNATHFQYTPHDSIAVLGALTHSLALYGLLEGLHLGLAVHALSILAPSAQAATLQAKNCTILYATPTQLRLLSTRKPLVDVRLILCGGGALTTAVRDHIKTLCPNADLHVFYGAAETSFVTLGGVDTPDGSVGPAYPKVEIDVRNPDAIGTGEIWVRSPYLFDGYLQGNSTHTRREGDWMTVGEMGHLDAEGNLFLRGRAGRSVTVADQTLFLEDIEAHISALPQITHCSVLARPDPLRGQHLIAVLGGLENSTLRETLLRHCKAHGMHAPRAVLFLDPFPLLPSGKPDLQRIATLTGATP